MGLAAETKMDALEDYNRYEQKFDRYEAQLNAGLEELAARLKLLESK